MFKAYFRFYEELNDFMPPDKKKVLFEHNFSGRVSVKDMIESLGVPHSEIDLILVNGNSVDFDYIVQDNDKISVYPVFESFDIAEVTHLREKPLRNPAFVLDVHLGALTRYLRMLGLDCLYSNTYSKQEIINLSLSEKRAILTRDRHLLKRKEITHGYWVRNEKPLLQTREILERFQLKARIKEFSRCIECNTPLGPVEKQVIEESLPPRVKANFEEFFFCLGCKRIYWKGSHYDRMKAIIQHIL